MPLNRKSFFESDVRICKVHGTGSFVDESGQPAEDGICSQCWEEARSEKFFGCPVHGLQPKAPGRDGCPIPDCLGASPGPTEDEIRRETESIGRFWPGGAPARENVLAPPQPGPQSERDREARESPPSEAREAPRHDGGGIDDRPARRDSLVKLRQEPYKVVAYITGSDPDWRDPFLDP